MTGTQYEQLFQVMDEDKTGTITPKEIPNVLKAYENWLYEKAYKKTMEDLYAKNEIKVENILSDETKVAGHTWANLKEKAMEPNYQKQRWYLAYTKEEREKLEQLIAAQRAQGDMNELQPSRFSVSRWRELLMLTSGPKYELAMNIVTIVNVFSIFARSLQSTANYKTIYIWMIFQLALNTFFLLEMIADWIIAGFFKAYLYHFRTWIETLCQILSIPTLLFAFSGDMNPDINDDSFDY